MPSPSRKRMLRWRGYALPRLAGHLGLGGASILLGGVWALWHLPLFFLPATGSTGQSFPIYLLQVTAISVTMAWLYWKTEGSLLFVMLMHASVNNATGIVPAAPVTSQPSPAPARRDTARRTRQVAHGSACLIHRRHAAGPR
jgi:hypothetical protein